MDVRKEQACTEMKTEQFESAAMQPAWKKRHVETEELEHYLIDFKMESIA